jgi:DNA-3-methyladenine glycosylase II
MRLTIKAIPPFDFDLSAKIFSGGDKQIGKYENRKYWRVIRVNNKLILVTLASSGSVDKPKLLAELKSNKELSDNDKKRAEEIIFFLFNLKCDPKPFYEDIKNDKTMFILTQRLRGLKSPTTPTVFEALIDSIIEQQISLNVAHSLEKNVIKTFGDTLKIDDEIYYVYPTPQKLASASVEKLRQCGLSIRKAEYIRDVSKLIADGKLDLEKLKGYEDINGIIDELCEIRGIGVWTAELTMVRGMQKLEAIPADDLGVRRCISHYYCNDRKISGEEARKIAEKWGKWKGLASFYLLTAGILEINLETNNE